MDPYMFLHDPITVNKPEEYQGTKWKEPGIINDALGLTMLSEDYCASSSAINKPNFEEECEGDLEVLANPYMANALEVVKFKIVLGDTDNFQNIVRPFKPTMAHQIFGHEEVIYGYRNLQITFNILPNSFHTNISITYTRKKDDPLRGDVADDIMIKLADWFPHSILDSNIFAEFEDKEDMSIMFGKTILKYEILEDGNTQNIYINVCDSKDKVFVEFHKRFQGLIVFYIDAASIIEFTDDNWTYFYVYQDLSLPDGKKGYMPIGFCTVYNFTTSQRARIAQQYILPNFQSKGIGKRLLGCVYHYFCNNERVQYITVESPCDGFTVMRDKLDLYLLGNNPIFSEANIMEGYSQRMEYISKDVCKMCTTQVKHLYYILLCYYCKSDERKYEKFINKLKKDIHSRYKKKLKRFNSDPQQVERVIKIKQIVHDDYLTNRRIHKDTRIFLRSIKPQLLYLNRFLAKI